MTRIIHISDTHFGTEVLPVMQALQKEIAALQPDIVILSGDITQRARKAQFKAAADFINALPVKTKLVIPGNHDIPLFNIFARFFTPYRNYTKAFGARQNVWFENNVAVLCYNATTPYRHTRGFLSRKKILKNMKCLQDKISASTITIACAHQPLAVAWPQDSDEILIAAEQTAQLWAENKVDIALSGHVHVPLLDTTKSVFPDLKRHFILAGAGTAISHRTRPGAPNSFNLINIEDGKIEISCCVFDGELGRFIFGEGNRFVFGDGGWSYEKK